LRYRVYECYFLGKNDVPQMPEDMEARMVNEVVSQLGNVRVFKRLVATIDRPKAMYLNFTKK